MHTGEDEAAWGEEAASTQCQNPNPGLRLG